MGDKTGIEWTDATWNPIAGCSIVSPGCTNCYAMKMAHRLAGMSQAHQAKRGGDPGPLAHYRDLTKVVNGNPVWTGKIRVAPDHILQQPLRWKRPRRIFVNSMSDLFHEDVTDAQIIRIFAIMALCPQHTSQILTKRSRRMRDFLNGHLSFDSAVNLIRFCQLTLEISFAFDGSYRQFSGWPFPRLPFQNVWLGVSVENQKHAAERIPDLLDTPAAVRFLSCEPLLGPLDLTRIAIGRHAGWNLEIDALDGGTAKWNGHDPRLWQPGDTGGELRYPSTAEKVMSPKLDWVIAGGESGPDARPMHPDWARSLRDQCQAASVPFFFKQWGEWAPGECADGAPTRTETTAEWFNDKWHFFAITPKQSEEMHRDDEPALYRLGKKNAGRTLDGRTWDEMPFHYARAA